VQLKINGHGREAAAASGLMAKIESEVEQGLEMPDRYSWFGVKPK